MKKQYFYIITGLTTVLLTGAGCVLPKNSNIAEGKAGTTTVLMSSITNYDECVAAGYPILKSNPPQCKTYDGTVFVDKLFVANPGNNNVHVFLEAGTKELAVIDHRLSVSGEARGTWFFEASFPVELRDSAGAFVSVGTAQGAGDWMSENFVPFSFILSVPDTASGRGTLILKKDNQSGDPTRDDSYSLPVQF